MWYKPYKLEDLKGDMRCSGMAESIGFELIEVRDDALVGRLPVDHRTKQPFGILHGGASCVLSESLGSIAGWMCVDPEKKAAVGLEINANHIRSVSEGYVTGICKPIHVGRRTHVWQTDIFNDDDKLVCTSRLTVAIIDKEK